MSNRLLSAAWKLSLPATEKVVLAALADCANDDGVTWIAVRSLRGKLDLITMTSLSERAIQGAIKALREAGHLTRDEQPGVGCTYTVHPRTSCAPAADAPPQEVRPAGGAPTPAGDAGEPPVTPTIHPKATPSSGKRERTNATRVPLNFDPHPAEGSLTAKAMANWPPGERDEQVEHFIDHHTAAGTLSKDWQASWRTWVKNWKRFNGQRPRQHQPDRGGSLFAACADDLARSRGS